jgi:DNA-binding response OmpR family regulator
MPNSKKILLVDDDHDIAEALRYTFEMEGHTAKIITHAEQVTQAIKQYQPDLIVMDILLSGNDGRHICKKLKTHKTTKHIPIMLISAYPNAEVSSMTAGADGFVAKPFDIEYLLKVAEELMQ